MNTSTDNTETQAIAGPDPLRRRLIFCAVGLAQGIAFYLLGEFGTGWIPAAPLRGAVGLFCGLAPVLAYLTFDRRRWMETVAFALGLALITAALHFWIADGVDLQPPTLGNVLLYSALITALIAYIALPFFQIWVVSRQFRFPYGGLFGHAWNNGLGMLAALVFVGALWLLLWLWAALFRLVDIDFFGRVFEQAWFAQPVSCLAFALGIALLRERERIIRSIQALVFALTTALAPVLPAAAVLFLILLPFAGLQTLWRTGHATVILLLVIAIGVLLANAIVRDGAAERPAARVTAWPVMALLIVMPLFTGLAFYAAGLRILQHGLTPDRFYAVVAIFVLGVYAVVYCYAVVRHKLAWGRAVPNYNPLLAAVVVAVAVLVQTPLLDPYRLSAAEQYQRLASGRADPAMFDYGFLKYRLGAPGRRALARIRTDAGTADRAMVDKRLTTLDAATDYFAWKRALDRVTLAQSVDRFGLLLDYVLVLPDGKVLPDGFETYLRANQGALLEWCHKAPIERCAIVVADLAGDDTPEPVFVRKWNKQRVQFDAYRRETAGWRNYDQWHSWNQDGDKIWQDLIDSKIAVVPPTHRELKVGETRVPIAPRR